MIRPADPQLDYEGAQAALLVAGKRQAVRETPEEVAAALS